MGRLMAAMSGGVDSSVAAALAVEDGHEVTGVTLKQWSFDDEETRLSKGCCTLDAVDDARRACHLLGIPHYTLDLREEFTKEVVDPFVDGYARGLTPNPCVRCNERVRFGAVLERALRLGFDGLVTGHYARVEHVGGSARLHRARCRTKDQSYVLYAVSGEALSRTRFPLGDLMKRASDAVAQLERQRGAGIEHAACRSTHHRDSPLHAKSPKHIVSSIQYDAIGFSIVDRLGTA
jgi:tRNA-uridine 2-sulfurtransferase